jgi:hypothetical protein
VREGACCLSRSSGFRSVSSTAALAGVAKARRSFKRLIGTVAMKRYEMTPEPTGKVEMKTAQLLSETRPLVSMVAGARFFPYLRGVLK